MTVDEQNNRKGIVLVFTTIPLAVPFLVTGPQLNHELQVLQFQQQQQQWTNYRSDSFLDLLSATTTIKCPAIADKLQWTNYSKQQWRNYSGLSLLFMQLLVLLLLGGDGGRTVVAAIVAIAITAAVAAACLRKQQQ